MKSIFDKPTRDELIARINLLDDKSTAQWGKMNVYQMLKHCTLWEEMILGKRKHQQLFIGRLIGPMILKSVLKDGKPMRKNSPTLPAFKISESGDIEAQKKQWIALMEEEDSFSNHDFIHPFFGKMSKEQIGYLADKHSDHHLRQFNG